jgi:LuxR family maltose regulon positive regulatory protein
MEGKAQNAPNLKTKLHQPPAEDDLVSRSRLFLRLDKGLQRPLTLVSAPAGYGKSILVSSWLKTCEYPHVWVSLDERDSQFELFLGYFLGAIESLFPAAVPETRAMAKTGKVKSLPKLAEKLANELEQVQQKFVLVLDDYHHIQDQAVNGLLSELLNHHSRQLHLVLISRQDPPLPIAIFRARRQLTEIRVQDIRFTSSETLAFLEMVSKEPVEESIATAWAEKTEGWVTGLRLTALGLRHQDGINVGILKFEREAHYVMDYLFSEVFAVQPLAVRRYLVRTAIVDRFCASLCDALFDPASERGRREMDGKDFLALVQAKNLFVVPLDSANRWFRFHHCFKQLLQNQLKLLSNHDDISLFHGRASKWFTTHDLADEALDHALAGGNHQAAAHLVEKAGFRAMENQQWPRIEEWLQRLPDDVVDQHVGLVILKAWTYQVRSRIKEMAETLEKADFLLQKAPPSLDDLQFFKGCWAALRCFNHYLELDNEKSLDFSRQAVALIPDGYPLLRAFASVFQARALQMAGHIQDAVAVMHQSLDDQNLKGNNSQALLLTGLCFINWQEAHLPALRLTAKGLLTLGEESGMPEIQARGRFFMGLVHYQRNELDQAEQMLASLWDHQYVQKTWNFFNSAFALALTYQAQGRPRKAYEVADWVVDHAMQIQNAFPMQVGQAFWAELALRQGRQKEAEIWAQRFMPGSSHAHYRFYQPQLTLAKILMSTQIPETLQKASKSLVSIENFADATHNRPVKMTVLALQALLLEQNGDRASAFEKLKKSITMADSGHCLRPLLDLGPQLGDLLRRLLERGWTNGFAASLLSAFSGETQQGIPDDVPAEESPVSSPKPIHPATPLTNREILVFQQLAQHLQNKEIAENLFISHETVKTHLKNIYRKLEVNNRQKAISRGRALGLLDHD